MNPALSVVIPTSDRALITRAIQSALDSASQHQIEVIVVPNGGSDSWKEHLRLFNDAPNISIVHSPPKNANIARNAGLQVARGRYVRFLDDDDYLHPTAAANQLKMMIEQDLDACSGCIDLAGEDERIYSSLSPGDESDWPSSLLSPTRLSIPLAHVFRTDAVRDICWDPDVPYFQDIDWLLSVIERRPHLRWDCFPESVGVWFQHAGPRVSPAFTSGSSMTMLGSRLMRACEMLKKINQLTPPRRLAAASGLWACAHRGFPFTPVRSAQFAKQAALLDADIKPRAFGLQFPSMFSALIAEWTLVAPRLASQFVRKHLFSANGHQRLRKRP